MKVRVQFLGVWLAFLLWVIVFTLRDSPIPVDGTGTPTTVCIVPHSHIDHGWIHTVVGYSHSVNQILESVVCYCNRSNSKFIWAEVYYFQRWYEKLEAQMCPDSDFSVLDVVWDLVVVRKHFEFVNGGLIMHDEALTSLKSQVDQMREGRKWLFEIFGVKTDIAYQIDIFGHSSLTPLLFQQMGYKQMVINRLDYRIKNKFGREGNKLFMWRGDASHRENYIRTHMLARTYSNQDEHLKKTFRFSTAKENILKIDGDAFINELEAQRSEYPHSSQVLLLWGDDFTFNQAQPEFLGLQALLSDVAKRHGSDNWKFKFCTLSEHFAAVNNLTGSELYKYSGDFFPYISGVFDFWTGFYSTRPQMKQIQREAERVIYATELLSVLLGFYSLREEAVFLESIPSDIAVIRNNVSVLSHHDAITGTSRKNVIRNYVNIFEESMRELNRILREILVGLYKGQETDSELVKVDFASNRGYKVTADILPLYLTWFNPLSIEREEFVIVDFHNSTSSLLEFVDASSGEFILSENVPSSSSATSTSVSYLLKLFLPPYSFKVIYVEKQIAESKEKEARKGNSEEEESEKENKEHSKYFLRDHISHGQREEENTTKAKRKEVQGSARIVAPPGTTIRGSKVKVTTTKYGINIEHSSGLFLSQEMRAYLPSSTPFCSGAYSFRTYFSLQFWLFFYISAAILFGVALLFRFIHCTKCKTSRARKLMCSVYKRDSQKGWFSLLFHWDTLQGCEISLCIGFFCYWVLRQMSMAPDTEQLMGIFTGALAGIFVGYFSSRRTIAAVLFLFPSFFFCYVLLPQYNSYHIQDLTKEFRSYVKRGELQDEIIQIWGSLGSDQPYVEHHVRLRKGWRGEDGDLIELRYVVRPAQNTEIVTRFSYSGFPSSPTLWTDNGFHLVARPSYQPLELVPGNYYPIISTALLSTSNLPLSTPSTPGTDISWITSQSMGVGNLPGSVEFMLIRDVQQDDGKGLNDGVSEISPQAILLSLHFSDSTADRQKQKQDPQPMTKYDQQTEVTSPPSPATTTTREDWNIRKNHPLLLFTRVMIPIEKILFIIY